MSRARAPPPRLTYTGNDFTGSPQENANRLKPPERKPKPASKLSQPVPGPAAFAAPAGPAASAAPPLLAVVALDLSSPDERDITGSGRRVRRPPPQPTAAPKVPVARKLKPKQPAAANSQKRPPAMPGEATIKKVKVSAASVDARRSEELPASAALNEAAPEAVTAPPPPAPAFAPPSAPTGEISASAAATSATDAAPSGTSAELLMSPPPNRPPPLSRVPTTSSKEDALLNALGLGLDDDFLRGLDEGLDHSLCSV
mmetsp:Transcript_23005/g.54502  ORF Transcript_23005/g.54502 Transcript_23005/m.54502 type:complete len:257 (+) Transcript_23005:2296-3066(+)